MNPSRHRLGASGITFAVMLLGWSAAGCDSAVPSRTTFAHETNAVCAATNRRVAALGVPPSLDDTDARAVATYLTREAAAVDHGLALARQAAGSPQPQTAKLWRDGSALVARMRAEAQALARKDANGLARARTAADRAWLAVSNDAMTNGVTPCGWLVH